MRDDARPGDRLPTVKQCEIQYNASRGTIVQALSLLEEQGRIERRRGSGCYIASHSEASSASNGSRLIGLVTPNEITNEILVRLYQGVERVARIHNSHVILAASNTNYETERQHIHRLVQAGCTGIVLFPVTRTKEKLENDYLQREFPDFPIVLVDMAFPFQRRPQIVFDNYQAAFDITEMLLAEGHRRIAFMDTSQNGAWMHYSNMERRRGYEDALQSAGYAVEPEDIWDVRLSNEEEDVPVCLDRWAGRESRASAVIAVEDRAAIRAIQSAQSLGFRIPQQLTVIGFDNVNEGRFFNPPFTTTDPDFRRAGELATRLIIRMARGDDASSVIYVLPVPIKRRKGLHPEGVAPKPAVLEAAP